MASKRISSDGASDVRQPKSRKLSLSSEQVEADPDGLVLTPRAVTEIRRHLVDRGTPNSAIRVGLRGGGCSGFSYVFDWDDEQPGDGDTLIEQDGARVYVDRKSLKLLKGSILDYRTSMMSRGFAFHNPNAKSSCGCGQSVSF